MPFFAADLLDLLEHATVRQVDKPWGHEVIINAGEFLLKLITVYDGHRTSLQHHEVKEEVQFIVANTTDRCGPDGIMYGGVDIQGLPRLVGSAPIRVKPGTIHRSVGPLMLIEVTTPENDDVVRHEDDYGREETT